MRTIQITAASRLHFGLLAPSQGQERRFGGVGVMIKSPAIELSAVAAGRFSVEGPAQDRVHEFAASWRSSRGDHSLPACRIIVHSLPQMHTGLGVGSQLGLSVARLLDEFVGRTDVSPAELAQSVRRGQRSAVGTYGFFYGGLIAEPGKSGSEPLAPLLARIQLPPSWHWLLVCPRQYGGLHGTQEQQAFSQMHDPANDHADALLAEMEGHLVPAAQRGEFGAFSASLYRFGHRAGLNFATVQGGAYNGARLQQIVTEIRALGVEGVGQSSWGPTIFALCPNQTTAQTIANQVRQFVSDSDVAITTTCNHGARVHMVA